MIHLNLIHSISLFNTIRLMHALKCYTQRDDELLVIENGSAFQDMCYIRLDGSRGIEDNMLGTRPNDFMCIYMDAKSDVRCFCGTDLCNLNLPDPVVIKPYKYKEINCTCQNGLFTVCGNQTTCTGPYCQGIKWAGDYQHVTDLNCGGSVVLGPQNGCINTHGHPHVVAVCLCDTDMCDPFAIPAGQGENDHEGQSQSCVALLPGQMFWAVFCFLVITY